jgi:hypothetical protein
MPDTVYGPWEQEEGSDYDEPKSGGDSHEDEFDEEYGEQQPRGDPDRPDNALEDAYQADIEYWEGVARLNAIARPFDPDARVTSDAAALNPFARPYDPDAAVTSDASAVNPFADEYGESSQVSLSSHLGSPDPDDFDDAAIVDPVGPPTPDSAVAEPNVASGVSFDPAVPFADAFGDGTVSPSSPSISSDRFDPDESYQAAIVDPGPSLLDSAAGDPDAASSFDPAVQFDPDDSYQAAIVDEPDVASSPSFAPEVEFRPDIPEQTDWNDFIG